MSNGCKGTPVSAACYGNPHEVILNVRTATLPVIVWIGSATLYTQVYIHVYIYIHIYIYEGASEMRIADRE